MTERKEKLIRLAHIVNLRFDNRDADDSVTMRVERSAVPLIMAWYGAYYAGDDYDVFISNRKKLIGINGELEPVTIDA